MTPHAGADSIPPMGRRRRIIAPEGRGQTEELTPGWMMNSHRRALLVILAQETPSRASWSGTGAAPLHLAARRGRARVRAGRIRAGRSESAARPGIGAPASEHRRNSARSRAPRWPYPLLPHGRTTTRSGGHHGSHMPSCLRGSRPGRDRQGLDVPRGGTSVPLR